MTTGVPIDLRGVAETRAGYETWPTKTLATKSLKALQERGRNVIDTISIHPARSALFRFWVIGRPDDLAEFTLLMCEDGRWTRGRLWDRGHLEPTWEHLPAPDGLLPATFTHVTRTVAHSGARTERYKTKSNGSCGRWVTSDDSVALCTCRWKAYTSTRAEARSRAAQHLAEEAGAAPLHLVGSI